MAYKWPKSKAYKLIRFIKNSFKVIKTGKYGHEEITLPKNVFQEGSKGKPFDYFYKWIMNSQNKPKGAMINTK